MPGPTQPGAEPTPIPVVVGYPVCLRGSRPGSRGLGKRNIFWRTITTGQLHGRIIGALRRILGTGHQGAAVPLKVARFHACARSGAAAAKVPAGSQPPKCCSGTSAFAKVCKSDSLSLLSIAARAARRLASDSP